MIEVEPVATWQAGVRQVLAYSVVSGLRPNLALVGDLTNERMLVVFKELTDKLPQTPVALWGWTGAAWRRVVSKADAADGWRRTSDVLHTRHDVQVHQLPAKDVRPGALGARLRVKQPRVPKGLA